MMEWRVGTFTMGVVLIAIGIIMIMGRLNGWSAIEQIVTWWPVIIIMLGLEVLISSILLRQDQGRVVFDGFSIFMIILILIICGGLYGVRGITNGILGRNIFREFNSINSKYHSTFKKNMTSDAKGKDKVIVNNAFGKVQIVKGTGSAIEIEADIIIDNNDEEYAKSIADTLIEVIDGNPVKIGSKRDQYLSDKSRIQNISINYVIKVPEGIEAEVQNRFGSVNVENISKSLKIENEHGNVAVKSIGGDLYISNSYASVDVSGVGGKAEIYNKHGAVKVKNAGASLILENSYASVEVEHIKGNVKIVNGHGSVKARNIEGSLDIENKFAQVEVNEISNGNLRIKNNNGSVTITSAGGDVEVINSYGSINLRNANKGINLRTTHGTIDFEAGSTAVEKDVIIDNQYGNINIDVPKTQQGQFKASTTHGNINNGFDMDVKKTSTEQTMEGTVGDGKVKFDIKNKNGNINIRAR